MTQKPPQASKLTQIIRITQKRPVSPATGQLDVNAGHEVPVRYFVGTTAADATNYRDTLATARADLEHLRRVISDEDWRLYAVVDITERPSA